MAESYFSRYAVALAKAGYEPFPVKQNDKEPAVKEWRSSIPLGQLKRWAANGLAESSIGLKTGKTPAVDIDVLDAEMSARFADIAREMLGDVPERVGQAPKRLFVCRTEAPFHKLKRTFIDPTGAKHHIEILGEGQFFVAYGVHPKTHAPFQWMTVDEPLSIEADALPVLDVETAIELLDRCAEVAVAHGWKDGGISGKNAALADPDDVFGSIEPKAVVSPEEIAEYMKWLPNDDSDYDEWLSVGAALHHQFDGDEDGFDYWSEWSSRSLKHNPEEMRKKWESFTDTGSGSVTTFRTIIKWSNDARLKNQSEMRLALINEIDECTDEASVRAVLKKLVTADLDPLDLDDLISRVAKVAKKAGWDTSKTYLRGVILKQRKAHEREQRLTGSDKKSDSSIYDLEMALAAQVLNDHFAGGDHLMQFGGAQWAYIGGVWRPIDKELVRRRVMETLAVMKQGADTNYSKLLIATREAGRDDRMAALVSSVCDIMLLKVTENGSDDPLNLQGRRASPVVNCRNGEIWFNTDGTFTFKHHDPKHRLTSQIACSFDPKAKCPAFRKALDTVFCRSDNPKEIMRHWLEVMGTLIQPSRPSAMWVLMKGPGGNGKSFLMDIVSSLMGPESCVSGSIAEIADNAGAHFTASLVGKLMFLDDDLKAGTLLPDDWMKKLSEPKLLTANPKHTKTFQFTSRAVMVALANNWPHTVDIGHGMQRRAQIFEMDYVIPEEMKDLGLLDRILAHELPGVLNLLVQGWLRVVKRGGRFNIPDECKQAHARWISNGNATARFVTECIIREADAYNMPVIRVYERYRAWASDAGENIKPLGRNSFYQQLESLGFALPTQKGKRVIKGVILKDVLEDDPLEGDFEVDDGL
jgi:P4 family phage/plasmid primase-like protien